MTLESPTNVIPGVGKTLEIQLNKLNIRCIKDLLFYFPFRYIDFSAVSTIAAAKTGEILTLRTTVKSIQARFSFRSRTSLAEGIVSDSTGSIKVTWFNQPYIAKSIHPGDEVFLSGKVDNYKGLQLTNPIIERISDDTTHTARIVPVYRVTEGLTPRQLRTIIKKVIPLAHSLHDDVPAFIKDAHKLEDITTAVSQIHFPDSAEELRSAQFRIAFDEVFIEQLAVQRHKAMLAKTAALVIEPNIELAKQFVQSLPFSLTASQKKTAWEIMQDLAKPHPMNRLLQGDVGSGKTLVALMAALQALNHGMQAVLLAPTEILAKQHYDNALDYISPLPGRYAVSLLTSKLAYQNGKIVKKAELAAQAERGAATLYIGTHALLQKNIVFKKLGLIIIDEQHRFGVGQRSSLLKQKNKKKIPHLLSMSATPIPRTLALSLYDDLSISTLNEFPKGRQRITTTLILEKDRAKVYAHIAKEIAAGRQAFIVTPRVEESETSELKSVKAEFKRLSKEIFPDLALGLLYGKMKSEEKESVMEKFNTGKINILVATSVIEIGIDVPNATTMLIEGAEKFGLAQLHQLRGRVGRGKHQSYCFILPTTDDSSATERLTLFTQSQDGFKLAEIDLQQRGFGSLFGSEQTGFSSTFSQYITLAVLRTAKEAAKKTLEIEPDLQDFPELQKKSAVLMTNLHLE